MRIGFLTGSIIRIGSGRTEAVPLAHAFSKSGCRVFGLEISGLKPRKATVEDLEIYLEPVAPHLLSRPLQIVQKFWGRSPNQAYPVSPFDLAAGDAILSLANRLNLDVIYAFHNTNVARILKGWPHSSRLLVINLIGFGIDPSRGGAVDTFPLQKLIFERPYWDLHITATKFEFEQYCQVYEQLGIDPEKLLHLPHSYDEERFTPAGHSPAASDFNSGRTQKTILYPVNVYPRKNIELAIDVLSIINQWFDCKLVITGSIWDRTYHSSLVQRAYSQGVGDRVEFLGGITFEKLVQLYHQADVTIYTSHQETFGHGIVESLGCGKPVVGPDWIIPCREILAEAPGSCTAPKDPSRFAAAILDVLSTVYEPGRLASFARDRYGNMAIAYRFMKECREIRAKKDRYGQKLGSINWKGLYKDAGDLL